MSRSRNASLLLCAALALFAPFVSGCGLGTVGIILALMSGGDDGTTPAPYTPMPAPTILFEEDFEEDLTEWNLGGDIQPALAIDEGLEGDGFDPVGSATGNGEAVTKYAFNLDPGLSIRVSMRVPDLGTADADLWCGVKETFGPDGKTSMLAGFFLASAQSLAKMLVNGTVQATLPLTDTDWHRYEVYVRPDGFVEFYIDGGLVLVSAERVTPLADYRPLAAGGKSVGSDVRLDSIEVFGYKPVRIVLFAENFGGDLSQWTLGSTVGVLPSLDGTLSGNPLPALDPGGNASGIGEAVTNDFFRFTDDGLDIFADLYVSDLGVDTLDAWFGLAHATGLAGARQLGAGAALAPGATQNRIQYYLNNSLVFDETLVAAGWYRFRIMIRPAGSGWRVEFHRNGQLAHVSAADLQISYDDHSVVVGGSSAGGTARVDNVAVLSPPLFQSPEWTALADAGTGPPSDIRGHLFAWDLERDRGIVAFGASSASASANVWALNVSGTTAVWSPLSPAPDASAGAPTARTYSDGVYARAWDSVYLFSGASDPSGATKYAGLWRLDFTNTAGGQWAQVTLAGPPARFGHTLVLDSGSRRLLLFGGQDNSGVNAELWSFDLEGGTWTALSPAGGPPSARRFHGACFDEANDRMIVFGGEDGSAGVATDSLWSLDFTVDPPVWTELTPGGTASVSGRWHTAVTADAKRRRAYFFGGTSGLGTFHQMYSLDLAGGGNGVGTVDLLVNPLGTAPGAELGARMVFDPRHKRIVLVGGQGAGGVTASTADLKDD